MGYCYTMGQYLITQKYRIGVRAEHVHDAHGIVISGNNLGFLTTGTSINFDYAPTPTVMWRSEIRHFSSNKAVFIDTKDTHNTAFTTSMAVKF